MKNFRIIDAEQLMDNSNFELIEEAIYNDLNDAGGYATHRMAMAMELENGDDEQYPLEDILDKFLVHIEIFLESDYENTLQYIFGGELRHLQSLKSIIGKRAYNEEFVDENGQTRIRLVIE